MKKKNVVSLVFDFFGFELTIICKNIVKILYNNDMVEVQLWDPLKTIQCDNNLGSPIVVLSFQVEQVFVYFLILDPYSTIGG